MREAIGSAIVGDDVYGEDPTVNQLQERVADLLGQQAALLVPSGSMANQIAIAVHTQPGDEIIVGCDSHSWLYESGGAAAISGVQVRVVDGDGRYTADQASALVNPCDDHYARTSLLMIEDTHNMGGGVIWKADATASVLGLAGESSLRTHLDGARLWNAAVGSGRSLAEIAGPFDSVSVCLSKGLGAPVGSLVAGSRSFITEAHRIRKRLGGGMRQAGFLAAAGIYALEHNIERLAIDHGNARFLAESLANLPGLSIDLDRIETNIVMVDITSAKTAGDYATAAKERGVLFGIINPKRFRLVTHLDVDRSECEAAVGVIAKLDQAAA